MIFEPAGWLKKCGDLNPVKKALMARWVILLYHNVSWENGPLTEYCTATCPPDLFREHMGVLAQRFRFVSIDEGIKACSSGSLKEDLVTVWFDDGLESVRTYAAPILAEHGAVGAISICSEFWSRRAHFWRFQLGYLHRVDGMRFLRSRMRKYGYNGKQNLKDFTLDRFSLDVAKEVGDCFSRFADESVINRSHRLFDDVEGLLKLVDAGWSLTNHSTLHYPLGESTGIDLMTSEFNRCEQAMKEDFGAGSPHLVIPFSRMSKHVPDLKDRFASAFPDHWLVLAGDRSNTEQNLSQKTIYRHSVPLIPGDRLLAWLDRRP